MIEYVVHALERMPWWQAAGVLIAACLVLTWFIDAVSRLWARR